MRHVAQIGRIIQACAQMVDTEMYMYIVVCKRVSAYLVVQARCVSEVVMAVVAHAYGRSLYLILCLHGECV